MSRLIVMARNVVVLILAGLCLPGCQEKEPETGGACSNGYNRSIFDECVAACVKCEHGVTTTCSTSCTLKGARHSPVPSR